MDDDLLNNKDALIEAVMAWSEERAPDDPGDAELLKAIWSYHGDITVPCEGCDGECGEGCAPCTVKAAHEMLDCFSDRWRKKRGITVVPNA